MGDTRLLMSEGAQSGATQSEPLRLLVLRALGVVYGDIATSPLYAFRTCFDTRGFPDGAARLGVLSLPPGR